MSIAPVNFYSSYGLVPVFEWVPVEPTGDATTDTPATPVMIETGGLDSPQPDQATDTPASQRLRLVFVGFEWRPVSEIATFPRPDWMDGVTAGCNEEADASKRDDRHTRVDEAARAHRAALAQHHPDPTGSTDIGPATTDASDSE
ncbi:MAG TPA: hypothetical protein VLW55_07265 [Burkholderiaceae bacterium]|nr:hypothetical protein [Burkholderiaceae bacterium]